MKRKLNATYMTGALLASVALLAVSVQASSVVVTNGDFELGAFMTSNFKGFDTSSDVVAWVNEGDVAELNDAGVEGSGAWWGTYSGGAAFMSSGDGTYNMTGYTIQPGDRYTVGFAGKSWDGASQLTATLFYDDPANVLGTYVQDVTGEWVLYSDSATIDASAASEGGTLGILMHNSGSAFANMDNITIDLYPFVITGSPEGIFDVTNQTVEATIETINSGSFVSASLSIDGTEVASSTTPSGTGVNTLSYNADFAIGVYTAQVIAVSSDETMTNSWSFEISQPAFDDIVVIGPTGYITNENPTIELEVYENFSIVESVSMWLDGESVTPIIDRNMAPTTTISYAASGLVAGAHTALVVTVGSPSGLYTNEWTFSNISDPDKATNLLHHWTFDEADGTTVYDTVGDADGTIVNTNFAWVSGGLDLFGGGASTDYDAALIPSSTNIGSYVDLPNGLLSDLPASVTFEVTYIADDGGWWQRVWDMGTSADGEDVAGTGAQNVFLTVHSNSGAEGLRVAVANGNPGYNYEFLQLEDDESYSVHVASLTHVVWIYDTDLKLAKLYVNGVLKEAESMTTVFPFSEFYEADVNNWIGRAQYGDPMFNGKIYDFRIYEGFMTAPQVADRYEAVVGDAPPVGPTESPVIQTITVDGTTVTLTWTDEGVGTYTIQSSTDLTAGTWTDVLTDLPAGLGSTNFTTSEDQEFYQVIGE